MAERPILFNAEMVRAILDGRKTQTRRVVKQANNEIGEPARTICPAADSGWIAWWGKWFPNEVKETRRLYKNGFHCPYGVPGGRLIVSEEYDTGAQDEAGNWITDTRPIEPHTVLIVTGVRVERVQEISEADAMAEGCKGKYERDGTMTESPLYQFHALWDSINEKRGFGWDKNPWVWVIEFEREAE